MNPAIKSYLDSLIGKRVYWQGDLKYAKIAGSLNCSGIACSYSEAFDSNLDSLFKSPELRVNREIRDYFIKIVFDSSSSDPNTVYASIPLNDILRNEPVSQEELLTHPNEEVRKLGVTLQEKKKKYRKVKMHIVLRHDISSQAAIVAAAHAPLGTYLTFQDDEVTQNWQRYSFVKILHKALNEHQFKVCREFGPHRVFTESSLGNIEVSVGFKPTEQEHPWFKDIPLWTFDE